MATALHSARTRFFDKCGKPLCGGSVYTYQVGTTTAKPTYTDASKTAVNTNPVVLDSIGSAAIFLDGAYRVRVLDRNGVLVEDIAYIEAWISATEKYALDTSIQDVSGSLSSHVANTTNPHGITKAQIGLSNVDNTTDIEKPISSAAKAYIDQQDALKADSVTTYSKSEVDTKVSAVSGGYIGAFATIAELNAKTGMTTGQVAKVMNDSTTSNNGDYYYNGTSWVKGYDALTDAKAYADANKIDKANDIWYGYKNGNLVGAKTKEYIGRGFNSVYDVSVDAAYNAKVIRVDGIKELYILNSVQDYYSDNGHGIAFFDANPFVVTANRITDNRVQYTDAKTGLAYLKVTVPTNAKYLAFNSKFVSTAIDYAIHEYAFSNSYTQGTEIVETILNTKVESPLVHSLLADVKSGNATVGDTYDVSQLLINKYLNYDGWIGDVGQAQNWKVFSFAVSDNDTYYVRITSALTYPFKMVYSTSVSTVDSGTVVSEVTLQLTSTANVYKLTVPANKNIKAVFLNVELVNGTTPTINLKSTLSIQKDYWSDSRVGLKETVIATLLGTKIVDAEARKMAANATNNEKFSRLKDAKVFAFGDSITEGTQGGYLKFVESVLQTTITNYGSSGARASRLADIVLSGNGLPRRDSATSSIDWGGLKDFTNVKAVTIQIGTNDLADMGASGNWGDVANLPTTNASDYANQNDYWQLFENNYIGNLGLVIEYIKSKNQKCEIFLITPPYGYGTNVDDKWFSKIIPIMQSVANYYSIPLINAMQKSGVSYKGMKANYRYSYDGTHFNTLGNELWGRYIGLSVLAGN